jgi:small subunit ribosomal protein S17
MEYKRENRRKNLVGIVIRISGEKTVMVSVKWKRQHPVFKKYVTQETKVMAHDEKNECTVGAIVRVISTRPLSRKKSFRVGEILSQKLAS